jgi:ABC-2 type transport system permease protein
MMGKILGVGAVGLTQFMLWVLLTFGIVTAFQASFSDHIEVAGNVNVMDSERLLPGQPEPSEAQGSQGVAKVFEIIDSINFPVMILSFIFFFIFGYLLYAALFAAIGSAVDNEADTQQFMFPITIPLILAIVMAQYVVNSPEGPVAFWLSVIPFTSPVIMMLRIPFGVPYWELALSMSLLVLGFLGTTWLAAKIYRTGILMYGKKSNYRELWKWITYGS